MQLREGIKILERKLALTHDSNVVKKSMEELVEFVKTNPPSIIPYASSYIIAFEIAGCISREEAKSTLERLRQRGMFPSYQKDAIRKAFYGKSKELDSWIDENFQKPGDVIFRYEQISMINLLCAKNEGGVQ